MEPIKFPKIDHSQDNSAKAFGLTTYEQHYIKSAILFEILSTSKLAKELYSNPDEVPENMCTLTGLLERAISHAKSFEQQLFMLFEYQHTYFSIKEILVSDLDEFDVFKKKIKNNPTATLSDILSKMMNLARKAPLVAAHEAIERCGHDFEKFIEMTLPEGNYDSNGESVDDDEESEIDKLIKKALKRDKDGPDSTNF